MKKIDGLNCILLVDDDQATNFINKMVIGRMNLDTHVQVVNDGQEALDYLSCKAKYAKETNYPKPGIIFLDINMPGLNGWEFLEKYKELPAEQKGKMVISMLTTSLNPDDEKRALAHPDVIGFVNKPLTTERVEDIISKYFLK